MVEWLEIAGLVTELDKVYRNEVPLSEWCGVPVFVDPSVPKGIIELRNKRGQLLKRFNWPEVETEKTMAHEKNPHTDKVNKGQSKTYDITGTAPDGTALPPRTVTQEQWREEKLGQQGYTKPEDLDDETDDGETPIL